MIEVPIPQDIREFEPTFIGPLTLRHFVCLCAIVGATYGGYFIEKAMGIDPMDAPVFMLPAIPFGLIGWFKPYGMKFEKFVAKAYDDNYACPTKRIYKIENTWDLIVKEKEKAEKDAARAAAREEGKSYTPPRKERFSEKPANKLSAEMKPYK